MRVEKISPKCDVVLGFKHLFGVRVTLLYTNSGNTGEGKVGKGGEEHNYTIA